MFYSILVLDLDFSEMVLYSIPVVNIVGYCYVTDIMLDSHNFVLLIGLYLVVDSTCCVIFGIGADLEEGLTCICWRMCLVFLTSL